MMFRNSFPEPQHDSASLYCCQNGNMPVNLFHKMGDVKKALTKNVKKTSQYRDVLKN